MSTGRIGRALSAAPWLLAGALWAIGILTSINPVGPDSHGLIDCAALIATFWCIARHYAGPQLRAGERIVSDEDYFRLQEAIVRGVTLAARQESEGDLSRTHLRSV